MKPVYAGKKHTEKAMIETHSSLPGPAVPLPLAASHYGYAALLDAEGNEQPITEHMILRACEEAGDALAQLASQQRSEYTPAGQQG
jgi:hypothetical protein